MSAKKQYRKLKDYHSLKDEDFYDLIVDVKTQKAIISEIIQEIIDQNKNSLVTIGILIGILNRQQECSAASMFLASRSFFRDSATLILTLMELRLDLEYIAKDESNELNWISQDKSNKKLWRVKDQILSVAKDESEKSADLKVYQFLSIIKHGNPTHGHLAFNISAKPDRIIIDENNNSINPKHLLCLLSYQFDRSFDAVLTITKRHNVDLSSYESKMTDIKTSIKKKFVTVLKEMIREKIKPSH